MGECDYIIAMTSARRLMVVMLALMLVSSLGSAASSQQAAGEAAGQIGGVVTDTSRAVIPGATITLDSRRLQAPRTVTSDASGQFRFTAVTPGTYFLRVQLRGFSPVTRENVAVTAGGNVEVNVSLEVGGIVDRVWPPLSALKAGEVGIVLETVRGDIYIAVDPVHAPVTSANFLKYVDGGFYNQGRFHRVTRSDNYTPAPPNRPAMEIIQGGPDPFRFRDAFPPIALERTSVTGLKHVPGTVSMARGGPDTATSDFFICLDEQPSLDFGGKRFDDAQGAAAFGRVIAGMDVVRKIQQERPMRTGNPQYLESPLVIIRATRMAK
jgi:peptidyl-prolyl cis-trans isomerase A (cyclophilin A)